MGSIRDIAACIRDILGPVRDIIACIRDLAACVRDITVWLSAINNLHINITGSHLKRVRHHVFIFNFYTNAY